MVPAGLMLPRSWAEGTAGNGFGWPVAAVRVAVQSTGSVVVPELGEGDMIVVVAVGSVTGDVMEMLVAGSETGSARADVEVEGFEQQEVDFGKSFAGLKPI